MPSKKGGLDTDLKRDESNITWIMDTFRQLQSAGTNNIVSVFPQHGIDNSVSYLLHM
jgi:hypothetical protein